jgi:uncharacterized phosphosugar-binding protein
VLPLVERLGAEPGIEQAAHAVAAAIGGGGKVWLTPTNHTLPTEATERAGGMVAVHALRDTISVQPGDCVIHGTPAGTSAFDVELAIAVKRRGAALVALTSVAFEDDPNTVVEHVSGKRLHELADVVVDLAGPVGDGLFENAELGFRVIPHSGVTGVTALWMIFAEATALLAAEGKTARFYEAAVVMGARERNERERADYLETGLGYRTTQATV